MKTSELTGALLDYWVARAEGVNATIRGGRCTENLPLQRRDIARYTDFTPSTDWAQGGPIIERECIKLMPILPSAHIWFAQITHGATVAEFQIWRGQSDTPLVAAMRAYVASKFGDEVVGEVKP